MNVKIYSKTEIEAVIAEGKFPQNTAVISFCDVGTPPQERVNYSGVCSNVMYIEMDDLERDEFLECGVDPDNFFRDMHQEAEFIVNAYKKGMDIICQCVYGESRSAGCAAAILQYFYHTGIDIFADNRYYPNKVVYHTILDALIVNNIGDDFITAPLIQLIDYSGSDEDIIIPDRVNEILNEAFCCHNMRSVTIPESVFKIDDNAFAGCAKLKQVKIQGDMVYIHENAFQECTELEFVDVSPYADVDLSVFRDTKWIQKFTDGFIVIDGILVRYMGDKNTVVIPDNVKEIRFDAFKFCERPVEVVIPKTAEKIVGFAFGGCEELENVIIKQ